MDEHLKIVHRLGLDAPVAWKAVGLNKPLYGCFFSYYCSLSQFERDTIIFRYCVEISDSLLSQHF